MSADSLKNLPNEKIKELQSNANFVGPSIPSKVREAFEIDNRILVRYTPLDLITMNSNVYCYDKSGNLLWIVEPTFPDRENSDHYVAILWSEEHKNVALHSSRGNRVLVDIRTGKITPIGYYP